MRLELAFGPEIARTEAGRVAVYTAPGGIVFEVFPVAPRTDIEVDAVLLHGVAEGTPVERAPVQRHATATGWPIALYRATLPGEVRLAAYYEFLVLGAVVVVRVPSAEVLDSKRTLVLELLASARADLSGDTPAAISELWEM
jgi:hypothetical protein